ncbi:MAG: chemotaxis-specific protein-glutamate methyltransferase CheB [Pseudobdellovibrio sp.]
MQYKSGIWMYIQTARDSQVTFIPMRDILKQDISNTLTGVFKNIEDKVQALKVVLIDLTADFFISKLPTTLKKKAVILTRRKQCDIFVDEPTRRVKVSKEFEKKIKTLIVDDSLTMRRIIRNILESDGRFEVAAESGHPENALELIKSQHFELITMDLHLPDISGAELIKKYFKSYPVPTVVISSLRPEESDLVLQSLENGAVDYIQKPDQKDLKYVQDEIIQRLLTAAQSQTHSQTGAVKPKISFKVEKGLLAIGASTGGTEAIKNVLLQFGNTIPPTVVVQHIPPIFSKAFADRLNRLLPFEVKEAEDGDRIRDNLVLIAPGGRQMKIAKGPSGEFIVKLTDDPPVNRHKPSVDYLFNSIVEHYKSKVVAVQLTGMGADGADGLVKLKKNGAYTIAQDESTSVVFGMPREAILRGGATEVVEIFNIGQFIQKGFCRDI